MAQYKAIFFCILVLSIPVLEARKSGGGGGSRGSSAARSGSAAGGGSFSPNRGGSSGGFNPSHSGGQGFGQQPNYGNRGGGFNQPNYGNRGGFNQQPHYPPGFQQQGWNRSPGFSNTGSGLGSASRGSTFKHALAGAAIGTIGGLLVFEAGKAIINSATTPFHHSGRDYYFDQNNYRGPQNVPRCSVPLQTLINTNTPVSAEGTNADQTLQNLQYKDGTKPKEVVWSCKVGEICCGTDCCPAPQSNNQYSNGGGSSGSSAGWIVLLGLASYLQFF